MNLEVSGSDASEEKKVEHVPFRAGDTASKAAVAMVWMSESSASSLFGLKKTMLPGAH